MRMFIGVVILMWSVAQSFAQPWYITDDATGGDCTQIGTWDASTKTCVLTTDIAETIEIASDNITLNGNGHTITLASSNATGIGVSFHSGITIKNTSIVGQFYVGIYLRDANSNTVINNTVTHPHWRGIRLENSHFNKILANTTNESDESGIVLELSHHNTVAGNAVSANHDRGIWLWGSDDNDVSENNAALVAWGPGIFLDDSSDRNTVAGNTVSDCSCTGCSGMQVIYGSNDNVITRNTITRNYWGILLRLGSSNTQVYQNNFISNTIHAEVWDASNTVFDLPKPVGGNYWDVWTTPDADSDGFVDLTFWFSGGHDNLPWALRDGWGVPNPNTAPVARCKEVTVAAGSDCAAEASIDDASYDPDGDAITIEQSPPGPYGLGSTQVILTVTDSKAASSQCAASVRVEDRTPPVINALSSSPDMLWPPNKKMVPVAVSAGAVDGCGTVSCTVASVSSNEPPGSDAVAIGDAVVTGGLSVNLRADRLGNGSGRVYTITVRCTDSCGNSTSKSVAVNVPHDRGK